MSTGATANSKPKLAMEPADGNLIIDTNDLLVGDILLYRPRDPKIFQRGISKATDSPYTHAAIYIGDGFTADSNFKPGVRKNPLSDLLVTAKYVAVLRSQAVFGQGRKQALQDFVDDVVRNNKFYNILSLSNFIGSQDDHFANQLQYIAENYGKSSSNDELAIQRFICSAFVVACYTAVGIIDKTAQVAYTPEYFSPGHLAADPTFGWLLGYLVPHGETVPDDDPCRSSAAWKDTGSRWW
ncbi:hypothetical protein [Pararhizobium sp.]|uniref:hypothetical protein n=1 Tax=Pararhizobium sp. TaxID=1977563 RepID=UPI003D1436E4